MATLAEEEVLRLKKMTKAIQGTLYFIVHKTALDVDVFLLYRRSGPKNICVVSSQSLKQFEKKLKTTTGISKDTIDRIEITTSPENPVYVPIIRQRFKTSSIPREIDTSQQWWNKD